MRQHVAEGTREEKMQTKVETARMRAEKQERNCRGTKPSVLDEAFLIEECLAPACDRIHFEQPGFSEGIFGDEPLGLSAIVRVDDQDAAPPAGAVIIDQC